MAPANILVVDDEITACKSCRDILSREKHAVKFATSAKDALKLLDEKSFDLVLTDLKMPEMDGIELLEEIRKKDSNMPVIVITGFATVETAVDAMRKGAYDYIAKPFTPAELRIAVEQTLEKAGLLKQIHYLRQTQRDKHELEHVVGVSPAIRGIYELVDKVAPSDTTVMLYGESGTGKEVIARAIHYNSHRSEKQFIAVDCATLAKGLLESELFGHAKGSFTGAVVSKQGLLEIADGGTLFLDEIANVSLDVQGKLLRVLEQREFRRVGGTENKKVDVRIIAATNKDLKDMVRHGAFRQDLFYRLNVFPIHLPPLRDRREDIPILATHFLKEFGAILRKDIQGFSREAMEYLTRYNWPGNVRELKNVVERIMIMSEDELVLPGDLPAYGAGSEELAGKESVPKTAEQLKQAKKDLRKKVTSEIEKRFLLEALERNGWNISNSAKETGMDRRNFQNLMRRHGLKR